MTHEEALNKILSEACPYHIEDGVHQYSIELHCTRLIVLARPQGNLKYEIHSVEKVKCEPEAEAKPDPNDKPLDPPLGYSDGGSRG